MVTKNVIFAAAFLCVISLISIYAVPSGGKLKGTIRSIYTLEFTKIFSFFQTPLLTVSNFLYEPEGNLFVKLHQKTYALLILKHYQLGF